MKQAETADASVSGYGFLYVTDPEGNPVQNLWFYWPDSETHYYSMPCGLLPVALMRSHYEKMRQEPDLHYIGEIVLADPNANDPSRQRWYSVEWDPSGTRAYHVVWDIETPDVWIETADEAVTIFIPTRTVLLRPDAFPGSPLMLILRCLPPLPLHPTKSRQAEKYSRIRMK